MMHVFKIEDALKDLKRVELAKAIREGKILFYPTDTVYAIGCNAIKTESVEKIIKAKKREGKTLSIIAPSKQWIVENCKMTRDIFEFIDKLLPGPYTVVLKARINIPYIVSSDEKIAIRIPRNEFCDFIRSQGFPFVTTSAGLSNEEKATSVKNIPGPISEIIDYAIDAGVIEGDLSRIFDLSEKEIKIIRW
ncbi:MAG: L-threonylcarbamoyladenylate synthase [Candidatus Aenigmatarchaeota archaeon]